MKKFITILILCTVVFTGCSSSNDGEANAATSSYVPEVTDRVTVYGEIVETIGNMVTLNLVERPVMREMSEEDRAVMRERGGNWGDMSEEDRAAMRERFAERGGRFGDMSEEERAAMQERFAQNGGSRMRDMSDEERAAMRERFGNREMPEGMPNFGEGGMPNFGDGEIPEGMPFGMPGRGQIYTGETKDIFIPVGAPVMESSFTNGEQIETEINLDKLKAGDIIEVTYASDGETVAKVVKQRSRMGGGRNLTDSTQ